MLNVLGTNVAIVTSDKFGRSRCVGRCPENVLHLVGVGQWMQVRSGCRIHRCPRCSARGRGVCAPGGLVRRPPAVAQGYPALTASSERPGGVDRVARPGVSRLTALENFQDSLGALRGIAGDITKVLLAESNLSRFVRHGSDPPPPRGHHHAAPLDAYHSNNLSRRFVSPGGGVRGRRARGRAMFIATLALATRDLGCESIEARLPQHAKRGEPAVDLVERSSNDRVKAACAADPYGGEAVVAQHAEMLRNGRLRDAELRSDDGHDNPPELCSPSTSNPRIRRLTGSPSTSKACIVPAVRGVTIDGGLISYRPRHLSRMWPPPQMLGHC
jgi:hypothetical protein